MCCIYSCMLTSSECKLTVLSWRCFLTSCQSCASIDIPSAHTISRHYEQLTREQPNIFTACATLGMAATCQKPSYAHFYFLSIFTGSLIYEHYTRECEFGNFDKIKNKKHKKKQNNTKNTKTFG